LFATGDYRYASYAIRKAVELDAEALNEAVSFRGLYDSSTECDRLVASAVQYVADHQADIDAREVLALNYMADKKLEEAYKLLSSSDQVLTSLGKSIRAEIERRRE
jgi:hypothetical protein